MEDVSNVFSVTLCYHMQYNDRASVLKIVTNVDFQVPRHIRILLLIYLTLL